jgi:redox-sensing transcriptional repressor
MKKDYISPFVIKRLPQYYRFLEELLDEGVYRISSSKFSKRIGFTASQIRQDLNCFGEYGQQGYGYNVEHLRKEISEIIGMKNVESNRVIIIGAGNIGQAICDDISFEKRGCKLIGIFDNQAEVQGKRILEHTVRSMEELPRFCKENKPNIAVLCVPKGVARAVCEILIGLGIKSFWNFTHFDINLYFDDVNVENVHLGDSLLTLVYNLNRVD